VNTENSGNTLRGIGHGTAAIYGRAAIVGEADGRPTLDAELLALAARRTKREEEALDIILVAADPLMALLMPLPPGLTVTGIVAEGTPQRPLGNALPMVYGIVGAREAVAEGTLLIVDPARGRVLVEPDAREIARLQAGAFRSRVLLGAEHTPAVTLNGREVAVWAAVRYFSEAENALSEGADGLYVQPFGDILADDADLLPRLRTLIELTGGGSVTVEADFSTIDTAVLVAAAALCRFAVALSATDVPLPLAELRRELDSIVHEEREAERTAARPLLFARMPEMDAPETAAFDALIVPYSTLLALTPEQIFGLPSLYLLAADREEIADAVRQGVAGVIVEAEQIAETKDTIREQE
jgi:hypothetical protein